MQEILNFIRGYWDDKWKFIKLCGLRVFYALLLLASSEILRQTTKAIELGNEENLKWVAVGAFLVTAFYLAANYCYRVGNQKYQNQLERSLQCQFLKKEYQLSKLAHAKHSIGDILTRATQNIPDGVRSAKEAVYSMLEGSAVILVGAAYMIILDWRLAILVILFNILFRVVTQFYDKKIQAAAKEGIEIAKRNNSFLMDFLQNNMIIRIFKRQPYFLKQLLSREEECRRNEDRQFAYYNSYSELQWMSKTLANLLILYGFGGWLVARGELGFSVILAFTMATDCFSKGIMTWIDGIVDRNLALPNIHFIQSFLEQEGELEADQAPVFQDDGSLYSLQDVSFSFGEKQVLDHVNLDIRQGEWIQITGPNGEGKSTLLQLLAGIYAPQEGKILYRGQELSAIGRKKLSEEYVYITQLPQILEDTAWGNLALSEQVDKKRADNIIEMVRLEKVAGAQPEKYSQGEKQRLCIGRAFYHLADQLVVMGDEIFSNVDPDNRDYIAGLIQQSCKGRTMLFICHEQMGIPFDRTICVKGGKILEGEAVR